HRDEERLRLRDLDLQRPRLGLLGRYPDRLFDLSPVFRPDGENVVALPRDLCARAVGGTVTFEAWVDGQPQPAWGDSSHGGTVSLPGGWVYPGQPGFYIGHLQPGDQAMFSELDAGPVSNTPMPTGVAHTNTVAPDAG